MKKIIIGARSSPLSLKQTNNALEKLKDIVLDCEFALIPMESPGDEDLKTDLRSSDPDFFTRYLDEAVLSGELDCAMHSAKDLPDILSEGIDWFWLPWREDPRDCIILQKGKTLDDLPDNPRIGISSDRREQWSKKQFPNAILENLRGTIGQRLEQLDDDKFDLLIMASAALHRLEIKDRICDYISLTDLPVPDGQGYLAVTYKKGNAFFDKLRQFFVKPVSLVGAGSGDASYITVAGITALNDCDVCLYDALANPKLLEHLPADTQHIVYVGKRGGKHSVSVKEIERLILEHSRRGRHVVRLKGGDPGIFGRLQEELNFLDEHALPYTVIPGVSSLFAATTGTGLLLTRQDVSRGFTVATPRKVDKTIVKMTPEERLRMPLVFFMSVYRVRDIKEHILEDEQYSLETKAAMVFGASLPEEKIITGTLDDICEKVEAFSNDTDLPGLLIIGPIADAKFLYKHNSILAAKRILITGSPSIQKSAARLIHNYGGKPIEFPLIDISPEHGAIETLSNMESYDWLILTSPSAVDTLLHLMKSARIDLRQLPKIMVCGSGTAEKFADNGICVDAMPESEFSAAGLLAFADQHIKPSDKVLRLRSKLAKETLSNDLRKIAGTVDDCILYANTEKQQEMLYEFDIIYFSSGSTVDSFINQFGKDALQDKFILAIGKPTLHSLEKHGLKADLVPEQSTTNASIYALAVHELNKELAK
ncbi:MAG: uroporphyrinogen-III C-methyltransferase [Lentisphaeria bacterium]|nr:uroporphyrinogen-III C-methyltransferase [Lentisphaeria bacterium]NQZ68669.1 uroporphyrinogen-III C-methyltransferase [Lentisphaeria bacterium]